ncbi:MAG: FG-GAP-like repeat-containing protein, partial [Pirellulales bacterium]
MTIKCSLQALQFALGLLVLAAAVQFVRAEPLTGNRFAYLNSPDPAFVVGDLPQRMDSAWQAAGQIGERVVVDLSRVDSRIDLVRTELQRFNRGELTDRVLRIAPSPRRTWTVVDLEGDGFLDLIEGDILSQDMGKPAVAIPELAAAKPKVVPHNTPATVTADPDGGLRLSAKTAELYGREGLGAIAVYDAQMCIGWWNHERDHAVWTVDASRAGTYDVYLHWSIPDNMAGNLFALEAGPHRLTGSIPSTGGFEHFRRAKFGSIWLKQGTNRVRLRSLGLINGELADLKEVHLTTPDDSIPAVRQGAAGGRVWQWNPAAKAWRTAARSAAAETLLSAGATWGVVGAARLPTVLQRTAASAEAWQFDRGQWLARPQLLRGLEIDGRRVFSAMRGRDAGVRLLDLDGDGSCELLVANPAQSALFSWSAAEERWWQTAARLPDGVTLVDAEGGDAGLRLTDVNGDGQLDLIFSNERRYAVHLFHSLDSGWSAALVGGPRDPGRDAAEFPSISAGGKPTGVWFDHAALLIRPGDYRTPFEQSSFADKSALAQGLVAAETARAWRKAESMKSASLAALARLQPELAQNGFARLIHNDGGTDRWHSFRGDAWRQHFVRQQKVGDRIEWETSPLTVNARQDRVQIVFAGALGYQSEPRTSGFTLRIDDQDVLEFDLSLEPTVWQSTSEPITL